MTAQIKPPKTVEIRTDVDVRLLTASASDAAVIAAARVSTVGEASLDWLDVPAEESAGLIRFLLSNRHGTPFEHNLFKFFVSAPIFVFREFHRHRIGFSYNEESGRYKELDPVFYVPTPDRPGLLKVEGSKAGHYEYTDATEDEARWLIEDLAEGYIDAYRRYEERLDRGFAPEVARMGLPVGLFSSMYVTCNARSLMSFLQLRTKRTADEAMFPSKPQHEINVVADRMEEAFADVMPITHAAFCSAKRVAP